MPPKGAHDRAKKLVSCLKGTFIREAPHLRYKETHELAQNKLVWPFLQVVTQSQIACLGDLDCVVYRLTWTEFSPVTRTWGKYSHAYQGHLHTRGQLSRQWNNFSVGYIPFVFHWKQQDIHTWSEQSNQANLSYIHEIVEIPFTNNLGLWNFLSISLHAVHNLVMS